MTDCFDLIEREFFKGPWVMGDQYTVADMYLFTLTQWLEGDGVDVKRFPKVADHWRRMAERPAVIKVLAADVQTARSSPNSMRVPRDSSD